jgi:uncharacterized protein YkwD
MDTKLLKAMTWVYAAAFALLASVAVAACRADDVEDDTLDVRRAMLARNNSIRTTRSLQPHKENASLMAAAQDHARYMARNRVMSHYSNAGPAGRAARHGFEAGVLENIAYGYTNVDTTFSVWGNSSGHYANMMSNTSDAGFGWAIAIDGTPYWCAVYGTPPGESLPPANVSPSAGGWKRRRWLGWLLSN